MNQSVIDRPTHAFMSVAYAHAPTPGWGSGGCLPLACLALSAAAASPCVLALWWGRHSDHRLSSPSPPAGSLWSTSVAGLGQRPRGVGQQHLCLSRSRILGRIWLRQLGGSLSRRVLLCQCPLIARLRGDGGWRVLGCCTLGPGAWGPVTSLGQGCGVAEGNGVCGVCVLRCHWLGNC